MPEVCEIRVLAVFLKVLASVVLLDIFAGLRIFASFLLLVVSTMPLPSLAGSIPTVLALARPEYLKELMPVKLFGSSVKWPPFLPIPLRWLIRRFSRWHDWSLMHDHSTSAETFDMVLRNGGEASRHVRLERRRVAQSA